MAKRGDRLGRKADPVAARKQFEARQMAREDPQSVRETTLRGRLMAVTQCVEALERFNKAERTNILAAVAEVYSLSLSVEN